MERASSSRRSWADEVEEDKAARGSPTLNPNAEPFSPSSGLGGRISFSDSEEYSGSEEPPAVGRGKAPAAEGARCRRPRHRRRRPRAAGGFMADARRLYDDADGGEPRLPSVIVHSARLSAEPDAEGFRQVHSRRRWRRPTPRQHKPVPADLVGLCFNSLGDDHVKAECRLPSRCRTCRQEGHRARRCPFGTTTAGAKRGRSPAHSRSGWGAPRHRASPPRWRDGTESARSQSTGRSPSIPVCCAPPSPEPVVQPDAEPEPTAAGSLPVQQHPQRPSPSPLELRPEPQPRYAPPRARTGRSSN
jgi:hypothetical protein